MAQTYNYMVNKTGNEIIGVPNRYSVLMTTALMKRFNESLQVKLDGSIAIIFSVDYLESHLCIAIRQYAQGYKDAMKWEC